MLITCPFIQNFFSFLASQIKIFVGNCIVSDEMLMDYGEWRLNAHRQMLSINRGEKTDALKQQHIS
jgi:hypothetical protein